MSTADATTEKEKDMLGKQDQVKTCGDLDKMSYLKYVKPKWMEKRFDYVLWLLPHQV